LVTLLSLTLIARPAPENIGWFEVAIVGFAVILPVIMLVRSQQEQYRLSGDQRLTVASVVLFAGSILLSCLVSLATGAQLSAVARAIAPYLLFLPLSIASLWRPRSAVLGDLVWSLALVGFGQAVYLVGLVATLSYGVSQYSELIRLRVTVFEPRATVPIFLALPVIGAVVVLAARKTGAKISGLILALFGVYAALATQTRSQLIAILVGLVAIAAAVAYRAHSTRGSAWIYDGLRRFSTRQAAVLCMALFAAGYTVADSASAYAGSIAQRGEETGDNGRIDDEWIPALERVSRAGLLGVVMGIGPGRPFVTAAGESRVYIHNQALYAVTFTGMIGFIATVGITIVVARILFRLYVAEENWAALIAFGVLITVEVYVQLFAVHKLFSFNMMMSLLLAVCCSHERAVSSAAKRSRREDRDVNPELQLLNFRGT
jgi:hypothetical protein